ncbi:SRPBCC family protein [Arthrobacter sp. A2-55]|uniref:SRPBCC family protein n=1 Tax=Arthrobacter sp. A2-55 TaxID=2897337 RepID=UPI0021CD9D6C|nr:SRPBCC domain-containing protein [Arthrobacter sp. A2-55]MCU6479958.1 SRPBCC domain-containing protein [Arthrobacter sp. A2-55]
MDKSMRISFVVDQTPQQAFSAINNVRGWWTGDIEGGTDKLGDEFTYRVPDIHYSKFRITEFSPSSRVAWLVLDSQLTFAENKEEWTGTTVTFDVAEQDGRTLVTFTHEGLVPDFECYDRCESAWGGYINGNLKTLIGQQAHAWPAR